MLVWKQKDRYISRVDYSNASLHLQAEWYHILIYTCQEKHTQENETCEPVRSIENLFLFS